MAHAPRNDADATYWFEHELRQYPPVDLDLDALRTHADRILLATGREGHGFPAHDVTAELGTKLGRSVIELPGGHVGCVAYPAEFASELVHVLASPHRSPHEWEQAYISTPRWDLGRPQPAFRALAEAGAIQGRVLDVGCGTGEHVLMCAGLGLDATGIDIASTALHAAEGKAGNRGVTVRFLHRDAWKLADLDESFDTVLDCGLFHVFRDEDRAAYLDGLRSVLVSGGRYFMLCFSDQEPGDQGPRRVTQDEIRTSFADGWRIDAIEPTTLDSRTDPAGIRAWLVALTKI